MRSFFPGRAFPGAARVAEPLTMVLPLAVMAAVCLLLWPLGQNAAMLACLLVTIVLRLCAAHFRWSLPRLREGDQA